MSDNIGPLLTFTLSILSLLPLFFAMAFWLGAHFYWLILNHRPIPRWLAVLREGIEKRPLRQMQADAKKSTVYVGKTLAWVVNLLWICYLIFVLAPNDLRNGYPYDPIFGNVTLSHIGGAIFEVVVFLIITAVIRWFPFKTV